MFVAISFLWSSQAWIAGNGDRFGRALLEGAAPCHGPCLISFYLVQFIYEYQTKERWLFVKEETHEDMLTSLMLDSLKTAADACPVATPARSGAPGSTGNADGKADGATAAEESDAFNLACKDCMF